MAQPGESADPAAPAETPAPASAGSEAEGGAASLEDMAALIAESATEDAEGAEATGEKPEAEKTEGDPKEEPKADEEPKPPADKDAKPETPEALRKGFAALARDRRKLQEREARAEAKVQESQAFRQRAEAFDNVVKRLHEDPIGLLREAGGDALINKALDGVIASEKSPAEREVEKLRREVEGERQRLAQAQQDQLVANWRHGIVTEVKTGGEKYDLVNSLDLQDAVVEAITQYHIKHNGAVLPVDVAAAHVEKTLEAALSKSKKFGARGAVKPPVSATPSRQKGATTLSSVASGDAPQSAADLPDDDDARFDAVLKQMRADGQLS
jgi:hypothetical protein